LIINNHLYLIILIKVGEREKHAKAGIKGGPETQYMPYDYWDSLIHRTQVLAAANEPTREVLTFYAALLLAQKEIYENLRGREHWLPSGNLEEDLSVLRQVMPILLGVVEKHGPTVLAEESLVFMNVTEIEVDQLLIQQWRGPSDTRFFEKALLQPYTKWLVETNGQPIDRDLEKKEGRCPVCGGKPQLSILRTRDDVLEGGGRDLLCATCLTIWPYRRVVCVNCGEEQPPKLGYFRSNELKHVGIEACDSCRYYIKRIDLTEFGLAVPLADEIAAAPLDLWAREHGYSKIELNLIGL